MCGIGLFITPCAEQQETYSSGCGIHSNPEISYSSVLRNIRCRGPDSLNAVQHPFQISKSNSWKLSLTSSVLSLRGAGITRQPLPCPDGSLLLAWNGQIFDWDTTATTATSSKVRLDTGENDGQILLDRIVHLNKQYKQEVVADPCKFAINAALAEVEGPYAFVLLDRDESKLYFGRDPLGRRSLLMHRSEGSNSIAIISVAGDELKSSSNLTEIACSSWWTLALREDPTTPKPIPRTTSRFTSPLLLRELRQPTVPEGGGPIRSSKAKTLADLLEVLSASVRKRVTNINTDQPADEAHVAVLFSGGLDCTTLALLADRFVPPEQPIDLLNVAFENIRAIEAAKKEREKRVRAKNKPVSKKHGKGRQHPAAPAEEQLATNPSPSSAETEEEAIPEDIYLVPDRITGLSSYTELCALAPDRRWNFVAINVAYTEYSSHRPLVETLMLPSSSVMDLSIASALYFASRAQGVLHPSLSPYTSRARVLISGLGADELLGGYSRHRQSYTRSCLPGLISELQLDLDRLPERNLGRDDRILSCHGKESRYPFLDRHVLRFLTNVPVEQKVDLERIASEGGGGDKRLLRDLAKQLGLVGASELKKRAMQFGTRAAKIDEESRGAKGHHKLS
ncbi:uncharacterized protein UDID_05384 [Ustilago sp. UG-2017a]|nr:uncharacterized protein UDID_05384 [Ustilago sp. UG-2017a]